MHVNLQRFIRTGPSAMVEGEEGGDEEVEEEGEKNTFNLYYDYFIISQNRFTSK